MHNRHRCEVESEPHRPGIDGLPIPKGRLVKGPQKKQ